MSGMSTTGSSHKQDVGAEELEIKVYLTQRGKYYDTSDETRIYNSVIKAKQFLKRKGFILIWETNTGVYFENKSKKEWGKIEQYALL